MAELIAQLENHEFDFVLAFRPTVANPKIESRVLFHHRLAAIVNERHALASRTTITLEELQRYDLALTRRGTRHVLLSVMPSLTTITIIRLRWR
jgi:hypothetical protein